MLLPLLSFGQLGPGSVAFTGMNGDGTDDLAFVTLDALPANTTVYFSDSEWTGTGFPATDESRITWRSGSTSIAAGTIITFTNINPDPATPIVTNIGSATITGNRGVGAGGDAFFAYLGTDDNTPTRFLAAISTSGITEFGSLVGTGLAIGTSAVSLDGGLAIAIYNGPRTGISRVCYPTVLNNAANWLGQANIAGDQSADGTAPDVPFSTTALTFGTNCPLPTISFSGSSATVLEGAGVISMTLAVANAGSQSATVQVVVSSASAQNGAEYSFTNPQTITFPANSTASQVVSLTINDDALPEADEYVSFRLQNGIGAQIGAANSFLLFIRDNDKATPVSSDPCFNLQLLTTYRNPTAGGSSEIVAYDKGSRRLFIANSITNRLEIVNFANPSAPVAVSSISVSAIGGINSVAVQNGIVVVAMENANKVLNGAIVFFDVNGQQLNRFPTGALPDAIFFSPDGRYVVTPNEGEPDSYTTGGTDPEGSVSIVDLGPNGATLSASAIAGLSQTAVTTVSLTALNSQRDQLRAAGVRIYGRSGNAANGSSVAQDLEPEYVAFSADSKQAFVTLQENNAFLVIDLTTKTLAPNPVRPLGYKNHNLDANAFDPTDQGGLTLLQKLPVLGMYQPDAIASFVANGQTYYITANEGDAREYDGLVEIVRAGAANYVLDPTAFPNAADLKNNLLLGRLNVTNQTGDTDGDGDFDQIYVLGGRSFSIWDANGTLVSDSGDDMERITRAQAPLLFNVSNTTGNPAVKNRSDDKGPEPEGVTTTVINGKPYAFIALERIGGVMVYDVSNPAAPRFVTYTVNRSAPTSNTATDDLGPEGIIFIAAADSPNGQNLVLLANEISNSVSVYQVNTPGPLQISVATPVSGSSTTAASATAMAVSTTLVASGCAATVRWSTGATGNSIVIGAVTATTVITATCSNTALACPASASITLSGSFTLLQPTYNCQTGAIRFNTAGGDGSPVTFFAPGIQRDSDQSSTGTIEPGLLFDPKVLFISATQGTTTVTVSLDLAAACLRANRTGAESGQELNVTIAGNPTTADAVEVQIRGAGGQPVRWQVRDAQGRLVSEAALNAAHAVEKQTVTIGRQAGLYLIRVETATQSETVKVLKQ